MIRHAHIPGLSLARWLLTVFSDDRYHVSIAGDCEEIWQDLAREQGTAKAHWWLWQQVFHSVPLFWADSIIWSFNMFKNYLKTTLRHLQRNRGYAAINIAGLAIGLAATLLILMWVQDELAYDRFHEKLPRLYRAFTHQTYSGQVFDFKDTPAPLAKALEDEFPEIEKTISLQIVSGGVVKYDGRQYDEDGICLARPGFLDMFTFPLVKGQKEGHLVDRSSLLITEEAAVKYFGAEEALGKVLTINDMDFKVSGVLRDIPQHSHLRFDFVLPFENIQALVGHTPGWLANWPSTYLLLKPGVNVNALSEKIKGVIQTHVQGTATEVWLQPVSKIWLYRLTGEKAGMLYVQIFTLVAFFVLLIACINFMNLSTAKAVNRAKEVGLRKVFGAVRQKLIFQFYSESLMLAVLALSVAVILVAAGLPLFNQLAGKEMTLDLLKNVSIWGLFVGVTILAGLIAGSYPALVLSSFRPVTVLGRRFTSNAGSTNFRRALVILQFTLSAVLLIGSMVVRNQIQYVHNRDLGYDNRNLLVIRLRMAARGNYDVLKSELTGMPGIAAVTGTDKLPISGGNSTTSFTWDGKTPGYKLLINKVYVDYDYINVMGMAMQAGRNYSQASPADIGGSYILNEEAIRRMNIEEPLGKSFGYEGGEPGQIVGVVKDYHFMSMRSEIEPLVMMVNPQRISYLLLRIDAENQAEAMSLIRSAWARINPGQDFEARYLVDIMSFWTRSEQKTESLVVFFTLLAMIISSLGLLGLATFMAQKRSKEMGIRRVLGASVQNLMGVMSREFIILASLSNVLAAPIAYTVMSRWLKNYAYHTTLSWTIFCGAALVTLIIASLTVSYQSIRAAMTNPVQSLRAE